MQAVRVCHNKKKKKGKKKKSLGLDFKNESS